MEHLDAPVAALVAHAENNVFDEPVFVISHAYVADEAYGNEIASEDSAPLLNERRRQSAENFFRLRNELPVHALGQFCHAHDAPAARREFLQQSYRGGRNIIELGQNDQRIAPRAYT